MKMRKPSETTWIDLANRALARLSMNLIRSFDEGSQSALQAELAISASCSEVLNTNDWKCATKRQALHPQSVRTVDGCFAYTFPPDFIRLVEVGRDPELWDREGNGIVSTYGGDLIIRYVSFPENPGTLDPMIISAISTLAAYKMALNLTADVTIQQQLYTEAMTAMTSARLAETQGEPDEMYTTNDWKGGY